MATKKGSSGNDTLLGDAGADVLMRLADNNRLTCRPIRRGGDRSLG